MAVALWVSACAEGPRYWALPEAERAPLGGAERLTRIVATRLAPVFELRIPTESTRFSMGSSVDLGAGKVGDGCIVAVGDRVDRAVHLFSEDGRYLMTIYGGGRDTTRFPDLQVTGISSGRVVVGDGATRTVWLFDVRGAAVAAVHLPSSVRPTPPRIRVVYDGSRVYELWAAPNGKSSASWDAMGIPLIRAFDRKGRVVGGYGELDHFSGWSFPSALNVGDLALHGDTLWYANAAQGRVDGYALRAGRRTGPARRLALPVFFLPRPPLELRDPGDGAAEALVEYHLSSFTVGPGGEFLAIQATSYPEYSPRLAAYQPQVVVSAVTPAGRLVGTFDLGLRPVTLAATPQYWFAIVQDTAHRVTRVFAYPSPFKSDAGVVAESQGCG